MGARPIHGVGLCAGIGGLEKGAEFGLRRVGLDYRCVGLCEKDPQAIAVLRDAQRRGWLDECPIWDDVADVKPRGFFGRVGLDMLSAGFPCQPWSAAGKRRGRRDPNWIWPAIARFVWHARPTLVLLENVRRKPIALAGLDLEALGYTVTTTKVEAAQVGAGHRRARCFLLAHASGLELREQPWWSGGACREDPSQPTDDPRWAAEPGVDRVVHGLSGRSHRLRLLGNAVVPAQAELAFMMLWQRLYGKE